MREDIIEETTQNEVKHIVNDSVCLNDQTNNLIDELTYQMILE